MVPENSNFSQGTENHTCFPDYYILEKFGYKCNLVNTPLLPLEKKHFNYDK